MSDILTQVGVGGVLAILIIREVLSFLKHRRANGGDSNSYINKVRDAAKALTVETATACVHPIVEMQRQTLGELQNQTALLKELRQQSTEASKAQLRASFMDDELKQGLEKARTSLHIVNETLQIIMGRRHFDIRREPE